MPITITITDLESAGQEALIRLASLLIHFAGPSEPVASKEPEVPPLDQAIGQNNAGALIPEPPTLPVAPEPPIQAFGVELDSAGIPWDGRIHASSRAKVAGGVWRSKRGVDPAMITSVSTELRAAMLAPPIAATVARPAVPQIPTTLNTAGSVPPAPSPSNGPTTFPAFMQLVTAGYSKGTITQQAIAEALNGVGITSLPLLGTRPDLIPAVAKALGITS